MLILIFSLCLLWCGLAPSCLGPIYALMLPLPRCRSCRHVVGCFPRLPLFVRPLRCPLAATLRQQAKKKERRWRSFFSYLRFILRNVVLSWVGVFVFCRFRHFVVVS